MATRCLSLAASVLAELLSVAAAVSARSAETLVQIMRSANKKTASISAACPPCLPCGVVEATRSGTDDGIGGSMRRGQGRVTGSVGRDWVRVRRLSSRSWPTVSPTAGGPAAAWCRQPGCQDGGEEAEQDGTCKSHSTSPPPSSSQDPRCSQRTEQKDPSSL